MTMSTTLPPSRPSAGAKAIPTETGGPTAISVVFVLSSLDHGGMQRSMIDLGGALSRAGHKVTFVLQRACGDMLALLSPAIELIELERSSTRQSLFPLIRFINARRPSVLITGSPHTSLLAILALRLARPKVGLIVTEHAPLARLVSRYRGWRYRFLPLLVRYFYPSADAIVAVSQGVAAEFRHFVPRARRVVVIHNPVVTEDFEQRAAEQIDDPWFAAGAPPVLVAVGRLAAEKDYPTLIRAFAGLAPESSLRLALIGSGPEQEALERLITHYGLSGRIRLFGFVRNPLPLIKRARLLVLTSEFEGFGNVIVEALACGTPVVSTDCEFGPREILQDGTYGALVPVGDVEAIRHAILSALDRPPAPADLQRRARDFSEQRSAESYLALIAAVAPGNRSRTR
jgi:glycosyltransferase involved in cell wall biosynthesis